MLKTTIFGGLIPKVSGLRLPDNASQIARDIMPGAAEFRPVASDLTVIANTGHAGAKTIYRLQRDADGNLNTGYGTLSTWIIDNGYVSYARGQVNQDLTERTVKTFDDGSAAPRMIDAKGGDRQLGVPRPAAAPVVTVNVVEEFTYEDKAQGTDEALLAIKNAVAASTKVLMQGAPSPGTTTPGYVDRASGDDANQQQLRVFRLGSTGGANSGGITDSYAGLDATKYGWVLDPTLGGYYDTAGGTWPSWAGAGNDHWCLPYYAYGVGKHVDTTALATALAAMPQIPPTDGGKLWTSDQVDEVIGMVTELQTQYDTTAGSKYAGINFQVKSLQAVLGIGGASQVSSSMAAFYASTATQAKLDAAFAQFAEAVWNQAVQVNKFVPFTDFSGG